MGSGACEESLCEVQGLKNTKEIAINRMFIWVHVSGRLRA